MTEPSHSIPEHVVLIVIDLAGGGTQKVVAGLAQALAGSGCRVTLITNRTLDGRWEDVANLVEMVALDGGITTNRSTGTPPVLSNFRWLIGAALTIRRAVRSAGPETPLLAFLPGANVLTAAACLGLRVPLVLSERNDATRQPLSFALRTARRMLYRTASVIATNRPADVATLESLAGRVPVRVVRNPPPRTTDRAQPAAARRILSVGRLSSHKRHSDIIAAFSELAAAFPEWTLRILGDGPERSALEQQVRQLGLEDRVELPGWSIDVGAELEQGALLVHASEYEGTSNAILEAMAVGLPIIASTSSNPSIPAAGLTSASLGISSFSTGAVTALTSTLRSMLRDDTERHKAGLAARDSVMILTADPLHEWLPVVHAALQRT